jgi:thioredoxin reductase (NADPH)
MLNKKACYMFRNKRIVIMIHHTKLLVVGSGPAGYSAAIYAARANLKPLMVYGIQPGGQLTITTEVDNYPGAWPHMTGPVLMDNMRAQAEGCGAEFAEDIIVKVDLLSHPFRLFGDSGDEYTADTLVIATGAQARWLGVPGEAEYQGRGVSGCATCDGFFYRGKEVVVVGGGNTAVEEALYLSGLCSKVTVIHRRDSFRAEHVLRTRLLSRSNVKVLWNTVVSDIVGDIHGVIGVDLRSSVSPLLEPIRLACHGVFVAIGHNPAIGPFRGLLDHDKHGYITVEPGTARTSTPGVFAAGDIADPVWRQAVVAAGMGCMAALDAVKFLEAGGMA